MPHTNPFIVDTKWLASRLDDPNLVILDGSWYLPPMNRSGRDEFSERHIPGAVFFDINTITEPGSDLPHTLASPAVFADKVGALGISEQNTIVVYDGLGLFSAPRVWWNFRVMGVENVYILDGGLPQWLKDGLPTESVVSNRDATTFVAKFDVNSIVSFNTMQELVKKSGQTVVDARPSGRFSGSEPEPRPGIRSGHMPGAVSIPFPDIAEDGKLLDSTSLEQVFKSQGIDKDTPIVTTCGSGVTAAAMILALETIGHQDHRLYDGSWAEWGSRSDTAVVTD